MSSGDGGRRWRPGLPASLTWLSLASLLLACIGLFPSAGDAVEIRHALLARQVPDLRVLGAPPGTLDGWEASREVPPSLTRSLGAIPALASSTGNAERAGILVRHLLEREPDGVRTGASTLEAYRLIRERGAGYCADYVRAFQGLAAAAGIPARAWTISFSGLGRGHVLAEVYDGGHWMALDVFNGAWLEDVAGRRLSMSRLVELAGGADPSLAGVRAVPVAGVVLDGTHRQAIVDYLARGMPRAGLWWGSDPFARDQGFAKRYVTGLGPTVEGAVALVLGELPRLGIVAGRSAEHEVDAVLLRVRAAVALLVAGVILAPLALVVRARRRRDRGLP